MDIHFLKLDDVSSTSAITRSNSAAAERREWGSRISIPCSDGADGAFAMEYGERGLRRRQQPPPQQKQRGDSTDTS